MLSPVAPRRPHVSILHGHERRDDYAWMRDRDDPALMEYLIVENAYTAAMTAPTASLQEAIYKEILSRIKETDERVPVKDGPWYYYSRTVEGEAYPIYARKPTLDADEEIILDQNEEAKPFKFYQLGGMAVSPDGNYLAALVDTSGYEDFTLRVRDLRTMEWLPDVAEKLSWGLAWASDNRTLFYVSGDSAKRPATVWRHTLGADPDAAVQVFHESDVLFNVSIGRSRSGAFVFVQSGSYTQDEWQFIDATAPDSAPRLIRARESGVEYEVDHGGDWFYVLTNRDGATDFKVMRAPVSSPSEWEEYLPHSPGVFAEEIRVFRDWMVRSERYEGLRRLIVRSLADGVEHEVAFPDAAYGVDVEPSPEFDTKLLRFEYSSLVTPTSVYDYDVEARTRELKKQQEVLGGYDHSQYTLERVMVTARDGARVPISLVYRGKHARDGSRPLLLYAYGSYGLTIEPTFGSARFSLIDRGFVFAIAHIRGGQEMGRSWYDDGKMLNKLHTFEDYLDVAEHLVREGYTQHDRLVAHGGSAGGLLMGAVINMRPDFFKAVVADVPFVDVINTMLDASIPLTAQEWEQWGNPQVKEHYEYMMKYSPYDNVTAQAYPTMLVMSGINDSRVAYWEPAKWVAKLRAHKIDGNPLLLQMLLGAGHGGSSGRYDRYRETAFRYAFMIDVVGAPAEPATVDTPASGEG